MVNTLNTQIGHNRQLELAKVGLATVGQLRLAKVNHIFLAKVGLTKFGFGQSRKIRMAKVGLSRIARGRGAWST